MTGKNILFISYDGMTDPLGQSQVIPYLEGLTKQGYRFTILSCDKPQKYKAHKAEVEKLLENLPIDWVSLPYHKNPPVLSSVYDFYKMKQKAGELHASRKIDMVHTRPGVPQLVALYLKKKLGIKYLNDIRGFWADERVDGGMWNLKNPLYKIVYDFFRRKEDESVKIADYNTCLTYKGKEEILKWKTVPQPVKVDVVPCSVDLELFDTVNIDIAFREQFKKESGISDGDFIVSYLGSIGGWYLTNEMLKFCGMLLQKKPEAKFLFISNNKHEDIIEAAKRFNVPGDKIIVKFAGRKQVPSLLSLSNYSLFFIKPCYSKLSSSPTKHGEIMAMGIPVITNSGVGDVKEIVEKYEAGFVLDGFSEAEMNKAIDRIIDPATKFNGNKIREGAAEFYSLDKTVQTYTQVYKKILG
ncbi:MAG: glycosyltransferase [Chitinophagaceae bacterium]|nr:glycosyltransferase [Chitinophagaceae bacterium]